MISGNFLCKISKFFPKISSIFNLQPNCIVMTSQKFYLKHLANNLKINLPNNELLTVGRSLETKVDDIYVSKKQLECIADVKSCTVKVKPIGRSICGVDGYAVVKDKTYTLGPGHVIELRLGFHPFEIVLEPPKEKKLKHIAKKPKLDIESNIQASVPKFSENGKWEDVDHKELLIYTPDNIQSRNKIAAFDIDGTIIKTKSGARFPKDTDDWVLNYGDIPTKFQKLYKDHFKIVFFTNQSGVGKDVSKIKDFKKKIENILKKISIPIQVYIALGKTKYRKPVTGMWDVLKNQKNDDVDIDLTDSFYVGDAAGREKNWTPKKPKDHSSADRLFALNVGIKFFTPEEYFQQTRPAAYAMPEFDPRKLPDSKTLPNVESYETPNVILMVGGPGSGKSHFCRLFLVPKNYIHINRDTLGSWQKCVKLLEEGLQKKKNCVVDNTNMDKDTRKRYIDVTKKLKVPCRCFVLGTTYQHSKHNNKFRELTDKSHVPVSEIIINNLKKNYQKPELEEGFDDIVEIPFIPHFNGDQDEKLYKMFLLEK